MRNVCGIVCVLVVGGCASQQSEQRAQPATGGDSQVSSTDPNAVDPERHDAVERTFARKTTELQDCWTREYEKNHDRKLEGDLTIQLNVRPDGKAGDVKVVHTTLNNADIINCVQHMVGGWDFPEGTGTVAYTRTVHLGAQF
jgi:hypothetical protein